MENLKILIPTDFSVQAEFAYLLVKRLGEKMPVDVHFLHVMNVPDTVTMDSKGNIQTCGEIDVNYVVRQKEIAGQKLAELKNLYGNAVHTHFALGKVTDAILLFAEDNHFDLIAMGTKGAWGLMETLSGSETQMIARKSKIPVLSLMCDRSDLEIKNILLVYDFNHPANQNLQVMHKLIKAFDTKIHLLQITPGKLPIDKNFAETNMKTFAELNGLTNFACHLLNDADVEQGVVHFNQMFNMDMVCIGTNRRAGIFQHSASEKLINHLFKPIISYHIN